LNEWLVHGGERNQRSLDTSVHGGKRIEERKQ
jgi:hypothetical protein